MEKINFCSAMQPKSLKEFPEERCEFCADYYRAADVDALFDDVRRLVESVGKYASLAGGVHEAGCPEDDTCSCHVMVQFKKAIAAVERNYVDAQ